MSENTMMTTLLTPSSVAGGIRPDDDLRHESVQVPVMKSREQTGLPLDRRATLALGLAAASATVMSGTSSAHAQTPNFLETALLTVGDGETFDPAKLLAVARQLAMRPYVAPSSELPEGFDNLTYDQYVGIRAKPGAYLWSGEGLGFSIEPLHRGFVFSNPVSLYAVNDGAISRVRYARDMFDFGTVTPPGVPAEPNKDDAQPTVPNNDAQNGNTVEGQNNAARAKTEQAEIPIDFSGFRIYSDAPGEPASELAIFQGATFFRAKARGQNYGVHAHTLMLRPADAKGEELPLFRAFWIERPQAGSGALVIHALLDSESVAGVVRFTLRPGDTAITDVEMTLIPRTRLDHIGIGGATANFLFGPIRPSAAPDTRVAVHDVGGLQIHNGQSEWLWRPFDNPQTLQISAFLDKNPKGFGLIQRGRDFAAYEDDVQRFELRPSLWVEPLEEWGEGAVQLIEVPTPTEGTPNIICYWRPAQPITVGTETRYAMRLYWCWSVPERPNLALVRSTRIGVLPNSRMRRFAIAFTGDDLGRANIADTLRVGLTASRGTISNARLWPYPDRKMVRVVFDFDPGNDTSSELRLALIEAGKPISESWLFRWTP
ncbi:glucan biosynthesis protein [Pseudochelatococcus sp. G4_1912]|uniref:glucan biosynthesis protein n=2 Tax=Pseudochelatococcus sp. G4_1912 TaxID=3114288 RepID=UPI0039C6704E